MDQGIYHRRCKQYATSKPQLPKQNVKVKPSLMKETPEMLI